jgi:hypothetical protein
MRVELRRKMLCIGWQSFRLLMMMLGQLQGMIWEEASLI